jgi:hypothetical protein
LVIAGMLLLIMIAVVSCGGGGDEDAAVDCSGVSISFTEVNAVIQPSCGKNSNCHASGSSHSPGALVTYSQLYNARNEIKRAVSNGSMPKDGVLSSDAKNTILCWIENGASAD